MRQISIFLFLILSACGGGGGSSTVTTATTETTNQDTAETTNTETVVDGLIAEFKFNGNTNSEDGRYSGDVNGAKLTKDRFGNDNSAYSFDGVDDYIQIPTDSEIKPRIFTVCIWLKAEYSGYSAILHNGYTVRLEDPGVAVFFDIYFFAKLKSIDLLLKVWVLPRSCQEC